MTGLSIKDALELADDDLPDGAYFACIADMAGVDYEDVIDYLAGQSQKQEWAVELPKAQVKALAPFGELVRHSKFHYQVRKAGKVVADFWMPGGKFKVAGTPGKASYGGVAELAKVLKARERGQ